MVEKRVNKFGQGPPPLFGQGPKEIDFFYVRSSLNPNYNRKEGNWAGAHSHHCKFNMELCCGNQIISFIQVIKS